MSSGEIKQRRWVYRDACARLREIEGQKKMFDRHRCQGWSIWSLIRPVIVGQMGQTNKDAARIKRTVGHCVSAGLDGLRLVLRNGMFKGKTMIVTYSSEWRTPTSAGIENIYFGALLGEATDYVCVELLNRDSALADRSTRASPISGSLDLWKMVAHLRRKTPFGRKYYRERAAALKADLKELEEECGGELISEEEIFQILRRFGEQFRIYKWLLGRLRPRAIALTVYTGKEALIAAAKSRGIRVTELQHGTIYNGHFAYSYDPAHVRNCDMIPFPDAFCAYGQYWMDAMEGLGYWQPETVELSGSVELDRVRAQRRSGVSIATCGVVVTTQGVYQKELTEFLERVFRKLKGVWCFIIRSHPLQNETFIRDWVKEVNSDYSHIEVAFSSGTASKRSTNEIIASAKWHASISSTCHMEALGLGVPTIVVPLTTSENLSPLQGRSGVFFPAGPEGVAEIIESTDVAFPDTDSDYYFRRGALNNLEEVLKI